jgi:uncharacterized membrane protein
MIRNGRGAWGKSEGLEMQGTHTRHGTAAMLLPLAVIILSLTFTTIDMGAAYRPAVAANGATIAVPSPTATGASASVKASRGGSARWGFVLAIVAAIAIFLVGGLFVVLRSRGEYLDEQARKANMPQDDAEA